MKYWKYIAVLSALTFLSFLFNLALAARFQGLNSPPKAEANPDQLDYELFAYRLSSGQGYTWPSGEATACRAPGTSFTLVPVYYLFGRSFANGRTWFCLLAALTCLATGWIAWQISGPTAAITATALLAIYPGHFYYSMHFLSEVPFGLWLALACGFTLKAFRSANAFESVVAGGFWGLALLTRPQVLFVVPLSLFCLAFSGSHGRAKTFRTLALQLLSAFVFISPWLVRNMTVVGKPAICTIIGGYTFWGAHNEIVANDPVLCGSWVPTSRLVDSRHPLEGTETERESAAWKYGREFIMSHPSDLPRLLAMKAAKLLSPFTETTNRTVRTSFAIGWISMAPLLALGVLIVGRRDPLGTVVLAMPCLATMAASLIFYGADRFRDGVSPVWIVFVGVAIAELSFRIFRTMPDSSVGTMSEVRFSTLKGHSTS